MHQRKWLTAWLPRAALARAALAGGVLAGVMAAVPARAEVTADQAAALQADLRAWVAGMLAPLIDAASVPLSLTPAGERYRAELGLGLSAIPGLKVASTAATTAFLRPLDGTRWAVEEVLLPTDFAAAFDLTATGGSSGRYTMHIGEQQISGEVDPDLASPTRFKGLLAGVTQTVDGKQGPQTTRMDKVSFDTSWVPAGGTLVNGASNSTIEGYATEQVVEGNKFTYTGDRMRSAVKAEGVDVARITAALRAACGLAASLSASGKDAAAPTAEQRAAMHALLDALAAAFTRVEGTQQLSGLHFAYGDVTGNLAEAELGSAFGAPDGNAEFRLRIAAAGLDSPSLPPGDIRKLVPKRVVLAPRISGVPKSALVGFIAHAIDVAGAPDADLADEAMQLLADNPATIGIDEFVVEMGGSRLGGVGQVQIASPTEVTGAGELRMTGLDALIRLLGQLPQTKMAVPFAVMLKGIGKAEGQETVWRIAYAGGNVTVNGTDLSTLIPSSR